MRTAARPAGPALALLLLLAGPPEALPQDPAPADSVEEVQLHEVRLLIRSIIRAQEAVFVERGGFEAALDSLPGVEVPPEAEVTLRLAGDGYDLFVAIEENPFACSLRRRLRLTPEDPPELGRLLCRRVGPVGQDGG